ncbi:hypothetical protein Dsin_017012 [Dipteronia sinensis]|uniref:Retrotransposon gag domain-containing protein n=1 Tax=Dipteronia sinensis TaxID=43782 RepID=A0AAE0AE83_9ROSI|nr:hypothetical protein Dsin_017012 [Dipteronia sinensis]
MMLVDTKECVARLERMLGEPPPEGSSEHVHVFDQIVDHRERIGKIQQSYTDLVKYIKTKLSSSRVDHALVTDTMAEKVRQLEDEIVVLKRALNNPTATDDGPLSKIKVPEPKKFNGSRNVKELENFLLDMEQYFKAVKISEKEKVNITSMYLSGDKKLWWRTRIADDLSAGRPSIKVWESLKKELKDQFLPCNTSCFTYCTGCAQGHVHLNLLEEVH